MVANPLIDQGTINRLRGSVVVTSHPELNITSQFLGKNGISISPEGQTTSFIQTQTGAVTSPEPYMMVTITVPLLRTQQLAALYKSRIELDARIGDITFIPDTPTLPNYTLVNCALQTSPSFGMTGDTADYTVTIHGAYYINSTLWNL